MALVPPAPLLRPPAPGILDEDAPHRFRGGGEEVAPSAEVLSAVDVDKAQIRLVNEGRRLKRLTRFLLR